MDSREIGIATIGFVINCSITVNADNYVFKMGENEVSMPRLSTTATAVGYKLYPYFGGDEFAPHEIRIWIKEI